MIQELLGAASGATGLIGAGERKNIPISTTASIFEPTVPSPNSPSLSPSPSPSSSTTTATPASSTIPTNPTPSTHSENLRCPRCDSSNTKFCYYNNYNLTQPRHFCKTCRRYWTKGGALRNVPIGGGCRKNKTSSVSSTSVGKSGGSSNKMKTIASEIGRSGGFGNVGFDHHHHDQLISSSPIMWASPQNSHILALLRATQNPNPNPSTLLSNSVKEEGGVIGTHLLTEPTLGLDSISQVPSSLGLCSPFWKNSTQNQAQQNGFSTVGEAQNSGIHELYQRLRSTTGNYYSTDTSAAAIVLSNVAATSSNSNSSSTILESAPVVGGSGELGYCWNNPPFSSWSDLSTTSGAYP